MARIREAPSAGQPAANCYYDLDTRTVRDAVRSLGPRLGGRLLEVGCGAAPYRAFLEPLVRQYVASDYRGATDRADVVCDGARLGFRSEVFDSVLCTQVLEHVRDPQRVLEEICRVLRPGGVVLLTVPCNSGIHMAPNDYCRFTEFGLRELCERVGLVAEVIAERGGRIATAAQSVLLVFEVDRMPSRHLGAAVARRAIRLASWLVRRWAIPLARRFPKPGNPLGYALLAQKPSRPLQNTG